MLANLPQWGNDITNYSYQSLLLVTSGYKVTPSYQGWLPLTTLSYLIPPSVPTSVTTNHFYNQRLLKQLTGHNPFPNFQISDKNSRFPGYNTV